MKKISLFFILIIFALHCVKGRDFFTFRDSSNTKSWLPRAVGFGFMLAASFTLDEFVRDEAVTLHGNQADKYFGFTNNFGDAKMAAIAPLLYGTGLLFRDEKLKRTSCIAFNAFVVSGAVTQALKYGLGRARPYNDLGAFYFNPFPEGFDDDFFSLPSGHSSTAWSLITPYAEEYSRWLYIIPVSVSLARIYKDRHWLSDVVLGGGLGYFAGWYMVHKPSKKVKIIGNSIVYYF